MSIHTEVILVEYLSHKGMVVGKYPHTLTYLDDKPATVSINAIVPANLKRAQEIVAAFQYDRVKARLQLNENGNPDYFMFGERDIKIKNRTAVMLSIEKELAA